MPKLSQIAASGTNPALTDQVVAVAGGATDKLFTVQQLSNTINAGTAAVATVIALQTLTPSGVAVLSQTGRGGTFVFNSSITSGQIANDPGWGILIPPGATQTGTVTATLNPSDNSNMTLSGGNLIATPSTSNAQVRSTNSHTFGRVQFEVQYNGTFTTGVAGMEVGFSTSAYPLTSSYLGITYNSLSYESGTPNSIFSNNGADVFTTISVPANSGDWLTFRFDFDAQQLWVKNNTTGPGYWNGISTANPDTLVGGVSFLYMASGVAYFVTLASSLGSGVSFTANFGASPFKTALTSGWFAWNTTLAQQSGAWVRQYDGGQVNFGWWGGIGDGTSPGANGSDNAPMWVNFGTWAKAQATPIVLYVDPGIYNQRVPNLTALYALNGISTLKIIGYGATPNNGYNPEQGPWLYPWLDNFSAIPNALISSTAIGNTQVTCLTPANASLFAAGNWVVVASLDLQYNGQPINAYQYDYLQVVSANATTGVVVLSDNVNYNHLSTFPDGNNTDAPCGKARIWNLDHISSRPWNVEHIWEGLTIPYPSGFDPSTGPLTIGGRYRKFINCHLCAITPSVSQQVKFEGCHILGGGTSTVDKMVSELTLDNCVLDGPYGMLFQSATIDKFTARNSKIFAIDCGAKNTLLQNCDIPALNPYSVANYGLMCAIKAVECRIFNYNGSGSFGNATQNVFVDGTNVSFANGIFKLLKSNMGNTSGFFNPVLGQQLWLGSGSANYLTSNTASVNYPGPIGLGYVLSLTEDSTYVYIETTLPYASMPSWATGYVALLYNASEDYDDCSGAASNTGAPIVEMSEAVRRGQRWWEFLNNLYSGVYPIGPGGIGPTGWECGNLIEAKINVIQASTSSFGSSFNLQIFSTHVFLASGGEATSALNLTISIDLSVAGIRDFTQTALTGLTGADAVTLNSVSQSTLPAGYMFYLPKYQFSEAPSGISLWKLPIVKVELTFDTGLVRRLVQNVFG